MKRRQGNDGDGLRASAGSWYFRLIFVPATLFAEAARRPVGLKLGFWRVLGAPPYLVGGSVESSRPRKDTSWEGRGFLEREKGEGERLPRFGGGEEERLGRLVSAGEGERPRRLCEGR